MENRRLLKQAKKKVKQKKDFYTHAMIMAATSIFLLLIHFIAKPWDDLGILIPISAMILSVVIHYIFVFGIAGIKEKTENWESVALQDEYHRLKEMEDRKVNLIDEDRLKLRELEKLYRDDDFV